MLRVGGWGAAQGEWVAAPWCCRPVCAAMVRGHAIARANGLKADCRNGALCGVLQRRLVAITNMP